MDSSIKSTYPSTTIYARLTVKVKGLRIESGKEPSYPYLKLTLGHHHYRTPWQAASKLWDATFEFAVNYHSHLFWTLQIDVFDARTLLPPLHCGRAEVPLLLLEGLHERFTSWFELRTLQQSFIELTELRVREPHPDKFGLGGIQLELWYRVEAVIPSLSPLAALGDEAPQVTEPVDKDESAEEQALELQEEQATRKDDPISISSTEQASILKKISGIMFNEEEYESIKGLLNLASALGQGVEVGNWGLMIGYVLLTRYYSNAPMLFGNCLKMTKAEFELPRIMYKYCMATYGWKGLNFMGKGRGIIADSIRSQADLKAVLAYLNLQNTDLLIFELDQDHGQLFRPKFFVCIDRRYSAVVLSIRGTMSFNDVMTDLACEYIQWNGGVVHSGVLASSRWFLDSVGRQLLMFAQEYGLQNVYIVGHSLGGSIAAMTTMMLVAWLNNDDGTEQEAHNFTKQTNSTGDDKMDDVQSGMMEKPKWPLGPDGKTKLNIHCYCYGMAPIATKNIVDKYKDYIDAFVYGEDAVARLSYGSAVDLKTLLVFAAELGRASHLVKEPKPELIQKIDDCRAAIARRRSKASNTNVLHLPGRIHHLIKLRAPMGRKFTVIDEANSERFFELRLRKRMMSHHFPWSYEKALENAYTTLLLRELESRQMPSGLDGINGASQNFRDLAQEQKLYDYRASINTAIIGSKIERPQYVVSPTSGGSMSMINGSSENVSSENGSSENGSSENGSSENIGSENVSSGGNGSSENASGDGSVASLSSGNITSENAASENATSENIGSGNNSRIISLPNDSILMLESDSSTSY